MPKKPIPMFRPHQMKGTSQRASQPSRKHATFQINNYSVCNTVYYKTMWFFKTKTQFFKRELFQNGSKFIT